MPSRHPDGKIESIEALRFFAALLVVLYHAYWSLSVVPPLEHGDLTGPVTWFRKGAIGVDIFFVISGFVMYTASSRRKEFSALQFMTDRFWRIYPVLWFALAAKVGLELVNQKLGLGSYDAVAMEPVRLGLQFLLVPMPIDTLLISPTWTLSLEMIFYLIFGIGFLYAGLRGVIAGVLVWYGASCVYIYLLDSPVDLISPVFKPIVLEFIFGVVIGYIYMQLRMPFGRSAVALGLAGLAIALIDPVAISALAIPNEFIVGLPAAALVYGLVATNYRAPKLLLLGGRASYVLYLTHTMVLGVVVAIVKIGSGVDIWMNQNLVVIPVVATILVAVALNVFLENPFQNWRRRRKLTMRALPDSGNPA